MKKKILIGIGIFLVVVIVLLSWFRSNTKSHSPAATATYSNNGTELHIDYCRPYKKGRVIFGDESAGALQPYGKYWRVGANEATVFETNKDILFGDKPLKAGKYQLYAVPGKDTWEVCMNQDWDRWGYSEADPDKDIAKVSAPADNNAPVEEQLLLSFDAPDSAGNTNLVIHWDQTVVKVPIMAKM